jgi:transcriptional regulator with XRE-family HTH domain
MPRSVFTDEYATFRQLLIAARNSSGLTQVGLAKKLHRPQSYVSKYERGERRLDLIEFLNITQAMDLDPLELIRKLQRTLRGAKQVRRS